MHPMLISQLAEQHRLDFTERNANRLLASTIPTPASGRLHGRRPDRSSLPPRTAELAPTWAARVLLVVVIVVAGVMGASAVAAEPAAFPAVPSAASAATLRQGDSGAAVARLQRRLVQLRYRPGGVDGSFGPSTAQAVMAFQKVNGLQPDTVVGPSTWAALDRPVRPTARSRKGLVLEIQRDQQVLLRVRDGRVRQILNTSTGRPGMTTPSGRFRVFRDIDGWRHAPLGALYRPKYFNEGIAIHGARDVPAYPASHGCARVSLRTMDWLFPRTPLGTRVWVY